MIKIKMKALSAGPKGIRPVGWEGEVPAAEARDLIAGKYAVALTPPMDPEPARVPEELKPAADTGLTRRMQDRANRDIKIQELKAAGQSNRAIARKLNISEGAIRKRLRKMEGCVLL